MIFKTHWLVFFLCNIVILNGFSVRSTIAQERVSQLQTESQKLGYALGMDIGSSLKKMSSDIDINTLTIGIKDIYLGKRLLLSPIEATRIKKRFSSKEHQKKEESQKKKSLENMKKSLAFLDHNKRQKGIHTTASGLQYEILRPGNGSLAQKNDIVTINYRGHLIDGEEFINTFKDNEPVEIKISQQIMGLQEGLELMESGSKYRFFIHPRLAYGGKGHGKHIKPYDLIIYEVELLDEIKN